MTVIREFTCSLTGDELVVVLNALKEEICILKSEYLEIESYAAYELARLQSEIF